MPITKPKPKAAASYLQHLRDRAGVPVDAAGRAAGTGRREAMRQRRNDGGDAAGVSYAGVNVPLRASTTIVTHQGTRIDLSPYVAVPGIVVLLIVVHAADVAAGAIATRRSAREEEVGGGPSLASVILKAAAEGVFLGLLRGSFLILLWFPLCCVLNVPGFEGWHPRHLVSGFAGVHRTPWPGLIVLACCLVSAAEGVIYASGDGESPYRWPFGSRARLRREAGQVMRDLRAAREADRRAGGGDAE